MVVHVFAGQSRNTGKDAVKELIQLRETRDSLKKWQCEYDALIEDENTPVDEYTEAKTELESVHSRLRELTAKIRDKQSALGVADRAQLEKLLNDPFLAARMNALALKQCLCDRLRSRKFELDQLERSFRKQVNDQKVDAHTAASVKSREPAISKLARSYNALCNTMQQLFDKGKAPRGAICPKQLELKGIFDLDVDDTIWEDIGLEEGMPAAPLPWLTDEDVCVGIKAMLEQDWCLEEEVRLQHECHSMRIWLSEEWCLVNLALGTDFAVPYYFDFAPNGSCDPPGEGEGPEEAPVNMQLESEVRMEGQGALVEVVPQVAASVLSTEDHQVGTMLEFSVTDNAILPAPTPAAEEETTHTEAIVDGKPSGDDLPREVQFPGSVSSQVPSPPATSPATGVDISGGPIFPGIGNGHPPTASKSVIPNITVITPTPESLQEQPPLLGPPALRSLPWLHPADSTSGGHELRSRTPAPPPAASKRKADNQDARGHSSKPTSKWQHR
ncbi:hypothetical protein DXG01_003711 [Tephrocybe rancida]|nr:hypothetical protein DXG01_003711 [Tephrocybe rancida]